ncbi:MAG: ATP-binding protein [Bacteroidetes bacterium]|nr:ATP-binding protein [Bacteroidota bacterium]MBS1672136.1 ATP-binding protein [Bacteroidota bacterium]
MITEQIKHRIIKAVIDNRTLFSGSDAKYANSLGINPAIYNRLKKNETEKIMAEHKWITLARRFEIRFGNDPEWITAKTPVFTYIEKQLQFCQKEGASGIYCDKADVGKTHAAKEYAKTHRNVVYVDCSQVKSKQKLIRLIAREFGVDHTGKYSEVYADLVYYLKVIDNPLIELDEAGDLDYSAFLELKALWNASEGNCGWYMLGADGLEAKWNRAMGNKKVGYAELFRRYGSRYQRIVPEGKDERKLFLDNQAAMIIKANAKINDEVLHKMIVKCNSIKDKVMAGASLTRVKIEIKKMKQAA